jgi:hypothetical protein
MVERSSNLADVLNKFFQPKAKGQSQQEPSVTDLAENPQTGAMVPSLSDAVVAYGLPRSLEGLRQKAGIDITAGSNAIQAIRQTVEQQLNVAHKEVVLTLAQADPTRLHIQTLKSEVQRQMEADSDFTNQLTALVEEIHTLFPALQVALQESQQGVDETLIADADRLARQLFV